MPSRALNSARVGAVNIEVMRAFRRLRAVLASKEGLACRLDPLEAKSDAQFAAVSETMGQLAAPA